MTEPDPIWASIGVEAEGLPTELTRLHACEDGTVFHGVASVERGSSLFAQLACRLAGFPPSMQDAPFSLSVAKNATRTIWARDFGGFKTRSEMTRDQKGRVLESFGPTQCSMTPRVVAPDLWVDITQLWVFGVPLPAIFTPKSASRESGAHGRMYFDISADVPVFGRLIRYHGWIDVS